MRLHRHRGAGLRSSPGVPPTLPTANVIGAAHAGGVGPGAEKLQPAYAQQALPIYQQVPPQAYGGFPQQQQQPLAYYMPQPGQVPVPLQPGVPGYGQPPQGQVPVSVQSTGGSYGQPPQQQQYQQGPSVPLSPQATGSGGGGVPQHPQQPQQVHQPRQPHQPELHDNPIQSQQ